MEKTGTTAHSPSPSQATISPLDTPVNTNAKSGTVDIESGLPTASDTEQEQTADEILAKEVETLPMRQLAPAFLGVAMTMFMAALDNSIVSTALPRIGTEFMASNKVELVFTCYVITFNAFQGLYGKFSNVFGRKATVFVAIIIFILGSILSDLVSIRDRGKYQGFISAIFAISALIGPVMGGAFVDKVSWRWCFYIQVAFATITIPTMAIMLKLPRPKGNVWDKLKGIDWLEAKHAENPIVPPYLWKNRNVVTLLSINIFMGMTFWSLIFYLPIYFQIIEHETATAAGLTMIPLEAGIFISSNIAGILVSKFGKYRPYIFTGTGIAVIGSGFGVAINGALFQNHLSSGLTKASVPEIYAEMAKVSAQRIVEIPTGYREVVEEIYLDSMKTVFKATIPMAALMFLLTFFLKHIRLNAKAPAAPMNEKAEIEVVTADKAEALTPELK
ncbi:hypothetical protein BGZ52_001860 [Haplosporangium bisporale]|nr:hypothetical protein BGZ52_001860 [Haplosporangium bisporale]